MNTPAKAPLTRQQVIDRAAELGITADRLRFFDEETINGEGGGSAVDEVEFSVSATELYDYTQLTDVALRSVREPAEGLFIAESSKIIRRAHAAGMVPRSYLTSPKWLFDLADLIAAYDAPIFIGTDAAVEALTGFHLHRGALAAMHRPAMDDVSQLVAKARRIVVIEDVVDHTNVGAIFRSAAAFGVDAVLVTPRCADPLYRRSIRVSMGTVFQVPWTRIESWPAGVDSLRELGFHVAALALEQDSVAIRDFAANAPERTAIVFGTEGDGLRRSTIAACDSTVMIPMSGGVDSLNVAAASAVACFALQND
ncbi:MAG: TrmH family RNA methyltransferase [Brevibacterium aurantiacum]|uniref:RNA methyltransferase n=1 Tax=Brevibacterium aurantiacum TaxID=273384 RepID=A0A1D7W457_BREAU|nr:RNA methyltransferase [Brevibacterium aurantiacum]AOP53826.1 RRNA methylase family protein [Brevibacterium aurantiacum]AZL09502.1 RNA methyltransferase [Brevibacterium aurantiacum]MDN5773298.1 RNA methyltransferase [Brevibacterium aurantiacum]PCC47197.1 RNA methyltransferase [Brevibacterium aurantiacum]PCC55415.1 RNA methyltransferase [Brevibacterium aurantiacum]